MVVPNSKRQAQGVHVPRMLQPALGPRVSHDWRPCVQGQEEASGWAFRGQVPVLASLLTAGATETTALPGFPGEGLGF